VRGVIEKDLRGTENMSGGMKSDGALGGELLGVAKGQNVLDALFAREAGAHQAGGRSRADDLGVTGHVIGVRVGNEGTLGAAGRVEGPANLGQMNAVLKLNLPSHVPRKGRGP
jgi:hypothetical protein